MVAQTMSLPNLRRMFIPDPGYMICEADLAGADAQIVAWEAGDEKLKNAFRKGLKIHTVNSKEIYGEKAGPDGKKMPYYLYAKKGVHATNYGASARALAPHINASELQAREFQDFWFAAHPEIKEWHKRTQLELEKTRMVVNAFGFRRVYFGRVQGLLPEALAWKPQSCVAHIINRGLINIDKNLPQVQNLLQTHDSLTLQYPKSEHPHIISEIQKQMSIIVPYKDELIIPVTIKISDKSWGDCDEFSPGVSAQVR